MAPICAFFINNAFGQPRVRRRKRLGKLSRLASDHILIEWDSYKQRIICYLLSHVNCCDLLSLKLPLLHSLEAVISPAKSQMLFPTVERLINANVMFPWLAGSDAASDQFICLVLACLDATAIDTLNERSGKPWSVYQRIIQYFFRSGSFRCSSR